MILFVAVLIWCAIAIGALAVLAPLSLGPLLFFLGSIGFAMGVLWLRSPLLDRDPEGPQVKAVLAEQSLSPGLLVGGAGAMAVGGILLLADLVI
jgi:hypothetical protein